MWTEAERLQLFEFYMATPRQNISVLVAKTGRSAQALQTEANRMGLTVPGVRLRRCIPGQHMFASWGVGNRICPRCADSVREIM